jgi:hypothetical protein
VLDRRRFVAEPGPGLESGPVLVIGNDAANPTLMRAAEPELG